MIKFNAVLAGLLVLFLTPLAPRPVSAQDNCGEVCGGGTSGEETQTQEETAPEETDNGTCFRQYCGCDMQFHECGFTADDCQALCPAQEEDDNSLPAWNDQEQKEDEGDNYQQSQPTQEQAQESQPSAANENPSTENQEPQTEQETQPQEAASNEVVDNPAPSEYAQYAPAETTESNPSAPSPISADNAQPVGGAGISQGTPDLPPPPNPSVAPAFVAGAITAYTLTPHRWGDYRAFRTREAQATKVFQSSPYKDWYLERLKRIDVQARILAKVVHALPQLRSNVKDAQAKVALLETQPKTEKTSTLLKEAQANLKLSQAAQTRAVKFYARTQAGLTADVKLIKTKPQMVKARNKKHPRKKSKVIKKTTPTVTPATPSQTTPAQTTQTPATPQK